MESAHPVETERKPLRSRSVSLRDAGSGALNACQLLRYVDARAPCASRVLGRSERAAGCLHATGIVSNCTRAHRLEASMGGYRWFKVLKTGTRTHKLCMQ